MFTGIIENVGVVRSLTPKGSNLEFEIECPFTDELKVDQSLAHNGVCLTVERVKPPCYTVTAIHETLQKSNLGNLKEGSVINLERCMIAGGRLDGHLVLGHVEALGECLSITPRGGSWEFRFRYPREHSGLLVEKGSICLNGISLTVFDVTGDQFSVGVIPYTYEHTNIKGLQPGSTVNLEFDIIGKYVLRNLAIREQPK